jgi:hypothetical protein
MNRHMLYVQVIGMVLIAMVLGGCGAPTAIPPKVPLSEFPIAGEVVISMKSSGGSIWAWSDYRLWRYTDSEWSLYAPISGRVVDVGYVFDTHLVALDIDKLQYFDGDGWQFVPGSPQDPWRIEVDDRTGIAWVSAGDQLYRWNGDDMTSVGRPPNSTDGFGWVGDIAVTSDGILWSAGMNGWIPSWGGLSSYDDANSAWEMVRPWRNDEDVPAQLLATTPNGDLWVVLADWSEDWQEREAAGKSFVEWALAHRDGETGEWTVFDRGLPEGYPNAMVADDSAVWLASGGLGNPVTNVDGLFRFDGETWSHYLSGTIVENIAVTPDGTILYADGYWNAIQQIR